MLSEETVTAWNPCCHQLLRKKTKQFSPLFLLLADSSLQCVHFQKVKVPLLLSATHTHLEVPHSPSKHIEAKSQSKKKNPKQTSPGAKRYLIYLILSKKKYKNMAIVIADLLTIAIPASFFLIDCSSPNHVWLSLGTAFPSFWSLTHSFVTVSFFSFRFQENVHLWELEG